ncbi:MAG: hypothetical protein WC374_14030, partial [Phycisphaerae bacterium]
MARYGGVVGMSRRMMMAIAGAGGGRSVSVTNICPNGNFASTSGWSHNGASFSVASNVAQFVANSQYDAVYRSDVSITNGHIYYVCETAKAPSASTSFYLTDGTSVVAASGFL